MTLRNERVRKELMRDISEILRKEIRGLLGVVSIVDVEVSHDNSFAKVIYSVLGSEDQIEKTMLSLLEPEVKEVELGKAEVRQVFTIGKTTKIAGCYVTEGKIVRSKNAILIRNGEKIFSGAIDQLKRFKDDVKEVAQGFECGISFSKWNDIEIGDIIEVSTTEEVERQSL